MIAALQRALCDDERGGPGPAATPREDWFPPENEVAAARADERLQAEHAAVVDGASRAGATLSCTTCGSADLVWFWFTSSRWTWENLCGTAGPMAYCDRCQRCVEYFEHVIN